MFFAFGLKSSILLIFFLHGIVFSILLFFKRLQQDNKSSCWLGIFTLLCSLYIAPFMFGYAGWYSKALYRDILFYTPFQQLFLLPPVLYFYFKTLLDKSFYFSKKDYLHFLPAILYLIYSIIILVTDKIALNEPYFYQDGKDKDFSTWYQVAGFISLSYYLIQSLTTYNNYKAITYNAISFADSVMFKWAQRFLIAFLLLLTIRMVFFIVNPEWAEFGKKFWYYICFSLLFYYISISGYTNSIRSTTSFQDAPSNPDAVLESKNEEAFEIEKPLVVPANDTIQEEKSVIADLEIWKERIEKLMQVDKMYEDPELTIAHLCSNLNTHSKKISQVINQGFNMNFNDFVNYHRTEAVIKKIEEGEHSMQTLLSLALECGFNSKSTFNRAFKRYTSLNPRAYIEKHYPK